MPYVRPGNSTQIATPSPGTNDRVFCTDFLVDVTLLFALKAFQGIPAQDIHVACFGYLVPEVFELNRRIRVALRPQGRGCASPKLRARLESIT